MGKKVTVIIPAKNEEKTIKNVIEISKNSPLTDEIIVINNNSTDNTAAIAENSNAKVVFCREVGKGNAMTKGISEAKNEIIVFLDADILNYNKEIIEILALPIINDEVEFVKSTFERITGGNVTQIAVKPLLKVLYPNLYNFEEPISGMIACKKSILEKLNLESDYGVDIGILLDSYNMGISMKEVHVGQILNMSHTTKTVEIMQNMSYEILKTIVKKAKEHKIL